MLGLFCNKTVERQSLDAWTVLPRYLAHSLCDIIIYMVCYKETQGCTGGKKAQRQQEPKEHSKEKSQPDNTDQHQPHATTTLAQHAHQTLLQAQRNHKATHSAGTINT
jgi:hypothetical protein